MKIVLQSGAVYIPGVKQRVTVQISDPEQRRWGFEFTARLNSDLEKGQAGDLNPVDNLTQVICEDNAPKPCASGLTFIDTPSAGTRNGTRGGVDVPIRLDAAGDKCRSGDILCCRQRGQWRLQILPEISFIPRAFN